MVYHKTRYYQIILNTELKNLIIKKNCSWKEFLKEKSSKLVYYCQKYPHRDCSHIVFVTNTNIFNIHFFKLNVEILLLMDLSKSSTQIRLKFNTVIFSNIEAMQIYIYNYYVEYEILHLGFICLNLKIYHVTINTR